MSELLQITQKVVIIMKRKWYILTIIFVILTAFTTAEIISIGTPSVSITSNGNSFEPGDVVYYTINISSVNYLDCFEVKTKQPDESKKNKLASFCFDENTKKATATYFYVIPDNIEDNSTIDLEFIIKDKKQIQTVQKKVYVQKKRK